MTTDRQRPQRGCPMKDAAERPTTEPGGGMANRKLPWMSTQGNQTSSVGAFSKFGPRGTARRAADPTAAGGGPCPNSASCRRPPLPSPTQTQRRAVGRPGGGQEGRRGEAWAGGSGDSGGRNGGNRGVCDTTSHATSPLLSWVNPVGQEEDAGRGQSSGGDTSGQCRGPQAVTGTTHGMMLATWAYLVLFGE